MATSKAVAEADAKGTGIVPALAHTPELDITSEDIALPRLYVGQFMSQAVKDGVVKAGDIYAATNPEDPDAHVLWSFGQPREDGPVFHVLSLSRAYSASVNGELQRFRVGDPAIPEDAWLTYNYIVALPDVDPDVPYKFLLTRTGRPTAKQINTVLSKNAADGPAWINAFQLTCAKRENQKGEYFVAQVTNTTADPANVEACTALAVLVAGQTDEFHSTGEEPAI